MRVLYVNWIDYRDPARRGGGVSVYQRNLIAALERRDGIEASFLASGIAHGLRRGPPKVVPLPAVAGERARRFQLVNSGTLAPAHADFGNPAQLDHPATIAALADFLDRTGPYDVIHYNNLEGIPARALALGERWPGMAQVLSLHNYFPFCPQVNLWYQEATACTDFQDGAACVDCLPHRGDRRMIRTAYAVEWQMQRLGAGPGTRVFDGLVQPSMRAGWRGLRRVALLRRGRGPAVPAPAAAPAPVPPPSPNLDEARAFAHRRAEMVALINRHCQQVLCVSDRVRQIALGYGIAPGLARTCYIGSAEAEAWRRTAPRPDFLAPDGTLRLAYLGYMRRDKGFPFLLQALAALPPEMAARLHLTVAARTGPAAEMAAMAALRPRLAGLDHRDGYTHAELDTLLEGVDLGLVPVMWEDNLPQVAIEMHARHIPLLCSDRGGAQELGRCPDLVFRAGDTGDFARAIAGVLEGRVTPADYWRTAMPPVDPDAHLTELLGLYRAAANTRATSGQSRQGTEIAGS